MVRTPNSARIEAVLAPTPQSREMGRGARNPASVPGATTTSPSGFSRSDATLATSLVVATPTETRSCSSS